MVTIRSEFFKALAEEENRPGAHARGYDWTWRRKSKRHLEKEPYCRACLQRDGSLVPAELTDHINPLDGEGGHDDANLQSYCRSCHAAKTHKDHGTAKEPEDDKPVGYL